MLNKMNPSDSKMSLGPDRASQLNPHPFVFKLVSFAPPQSFHLKQLALSWVTRSSTLFCHGLGSRWEHCCETHGI